MKKLLLLALCTALIFCLAGCKGEEDKKEPTVTEAQSETQPAPAEPEPEEDLLDLSGSWGVELGAEQLLKLSGYSVDRLLSEQFEITPDPSIFEFAKTAFATLSFDGNGNAMLTVTGADYDAVMLDTYRVICEYLSNYDNAEALYYQSRADLDQRAAARFGTESWELGIKKLYNEYSSAVSDMPSADITLTLSYEETDGGMTLDQNSFDYADNTLSGELFGTGAVITKQ